MPDGPLPVAVLDLRARNTAFDRANPEFALFRSAHDQAMLLMEWYHMQHPRDSETLALFRSDMAAIIRDRSPHTSAAYAQMGMSLSALCRAFKQQHDYY